MSREMEIIKGMQVKGAFLGFVMVSIGALSMRMDVFLGVLVGALIAYGDFVLLCFLAGELEDMGSRGVFWGVQIFKYLIISIILGLLFFSKLVNPIAMVCGLSLIVLIPFTEVFRLKNI